MRMLRMGLTIGATLLLVGGAAVAKDSHSAAAATDDDAQQVSEPVDPDDAADIDADHNPDDVGQKALTPPRILSPGEDQDAEDSESDDD